jgi:hypothetical protein
MSTTGFNSSMAVISPTWHPRCKTPHHPRGANAVTKTHSKTVPSPDDQLIPLVDGELAIVTGGLLPWEALPAMSIATGYGAWERAMKAKGLL